MVIRSEGVHSNKFIDKFNLSIMSYRDFVIISSKFYLIILIYF